MKHKIQIKTKIYTALGFIAFFVLLTCFFLSGNNYELLRNVFDARYTGDELREQLLDLGVRGHITVVILSMFQVVVAFLPAEPVQVLAGISFGFPLGLFCCAIGVFFGNLIIFILYRVYGEAIRECFVKNIHVNFEKAATSDKLAVIIFILYFLPAIPYGMICFFAASVGMKYPRYAILTFLGSLPSICIGVGLGNMAIEIGWIVSLCVLLLLLVILTIMLINKEKFFAKINAYIEKHSAGANTTVRFFRPIKLLFPYMISRIVLFFLGVRVRYTDHVGDSMQTPCVVLCNHGSFIDFAYAGKLLRKKSPNFIVARLYFYKKFLGNLLRSVGCFPKSMFTLDYESVKNSLTVLRNGGVLAMMPEARLSTVGRFEDIQPGTYSFLKKMNVPIYTITIHGDYFADPKWGKGVRRGSLVEATLESLLTADEVKKLSVEQIQEKIEARLTYDEFSWLNERPNVHYRSKKMAEGLENILTTCPVCGAKYTISTKGKDVFCEKCGKLATIDDRYSFVTGTPFAHFADWYDWQMKTMKEQIASDPAFALTSDVTLYRPSKDGKHMLRRSGEGVCVLNAEGLLYHGTQDGEDFEFRLPMKQIYRLLFGAGEDFEVYVGSEIYYFVPEERRSAVDWYIASMIFSDQANL